MNKSVKPNYKGFVKIIRRMAKRGHPIDTSLLAKYADRFNLPIPTREELLTGKETNA